MIHQHKTDGKLTYRAYSLRDLGEGIGHEYLFLAAFDTTEAAKDALVVALTAEMAKFRHRLTLLNAALHSGGDPDVHDWEEAVQQAGGEAQNDMYFLLTHAQELFASTHDKHYDGLTSLHGEAAVEYARRHGHQVRHTEFGSDGNYAVDELVSPGQAFELLPETQKRRVFIEVPDDCVEPDLPRNISYYEAEKAERERPRTPAELRASAARWRQRAQDDLNDAKELEERAAALESAQ